jgi:vanillate O-demethylase ferredoxin subunit
MNAVRQASSHWPAANVHCEYFSPSAHASNAELTNAMPAGEMQEAIGVGFQVKIASSGAVFDVPNDKSIVEVLREHGIDVETSCESGLCGTCRTRYLEGLPEHRDYVLDDEEKKQYVLICCARARSPLIVLDL